MFRPVGLLATQIAPPDTAVPYGSRDFSVRASRGLLPSHAPDMLTVRIGPLTVWGRAPHQIRSLVGCSPNAGAHLLLEAGATYERTLEAVRCSPMLGRIVDKLLVRIIERLSNFPFKKDHNPKNNDVVECRMQ